MGEQNNTENQGEQEKANPQQEPSVGKPEGKFRIHPIISLLIIALAEIGLILWQLYDKLLPSFPITANAILLLSIFCFGGIGVHNVIKSDEFQKNYSSYFKRVWGSYAGFCLILTALFVSVSWPESQPKLHLALYAHLSDSPEVKLDFTNSFWPAKIKGDTFTFPTNMPFVVVDVAKTDPQFTLNLGVFNDSAPNFSSSKYSVEKPEITIWIAKADMGETLSLSEDSKWEGIVSNGKMTNGADVKFPGKVLQYTFREPLRPGNGDSAPGLTFNMQEKLGSVKIAVLTDGKDVPTNLYFFNLVGLPSNETVSKIRFDTNIVVGWNWQYRPVSYRPIDTPIIVSPSRVNLSDGKTAFGTKVDISNPSSNNLYAITFSVEMENGTVPISSPQIDLSEPDGKENASRGGLQMPFETSVDFIGGTQLRLFTIPVLLANDHRSLWIRGTVLTNSSADISVWQSLNSFPEIKYMTNGAWLWPVLSTNSPFWIHNGLQPLDLNIGITKWVGTNGFTNDSQIIPSRP